MTNPFDLLTRNDGAHTPLRLAPVLLSLGLAFLGGHLIAWVYQATRGERTLSRSFVSALLMMPVLVALFMLVLENNVAIAFGMMSVLAIVRFRNVLDDTQDTTYVLSSIVVGLAAGTQRYSIAVVGTLLIAALFFYLHVVRFGSRNRSGLVVNLQWTRSPAELAELAALLGTHGRHVECTSHRARETGGTDVAYRIVLRHPGRLELALSEIRALPGVTRLTSVLDKEDNA